MNQHLLWVLGERTLWHFNTTFGSSRIAKPAYPVWPTNNRYSSTGFNKATPTSYPFKVWELAEGITPPKSTNHSLYLIKLTFDCSYPEGNFGGNQLTELYQACYYIVLHYTKVVIDIHIYITKSDHFLSDFHLLVHLHYRCSWNKTHFIIVWG